MGRKAGLWIAAAAIAITAAIGAAAVFGAGGGGSATMKRAGALHLRARVDVPRTARAAEAIAKHKPPLVKYGFTQPQAIPANAESSVIVGGCPRRYHITNGSVAAVRPSDVQYFTIRGSGPYPNKRGVVKRWFIDLTNSNPTFPVNAVGFIVCQTR
jgi:hypothetical protein